MTRSRRGRRSFASALAAIAAALTAGTACGDPIIVLGDSPGELRIVAGVPESQGTRLGENAIRSLFTGPQSLATAGDTVVYIADPASQRVLRLRIPGELDIILGSAFCASPAEVCLDQPAGLAVDPSARLIVTDVGAHLIWRVDPATGAAETIAGTGEAMSTEDGATASGSPVHSPTGVAVGSDGSIYFSERARHVVRIIRPDGTLGTVAGTGSRGSGEDGVPATESPLAFPEGLAVHAGMLFIAERGNHRVRVVDLGSGMIRTVAGSGTPGFGGDGGPATAAQFDSPVEVALSPAGGRLFVADRANDRVRVVNLRTGSITTFAGTGADAYNGDLLPAGETALSSPRGLAVSPSGLLYIADTNHYVVRRTAIVF